MIPTTLTQRLRRTLFAMATAGLLAGPVLAQQPDKPADKPADALPLSRVVMFNSGVGYFEHAAKSRATPRST